MADDTSNKSKENAKDVQELKEHQLEGISGGASHISRKQRNCKKTRGLDGTRVSLGLSLAPVLQRSTAMKVVG